MTQPICLGDPLSSGGAVIQCRSASQRINGVAVAVVGDLADCLLHKGVFAFIEGHPLRRINGLAVVMAGHRLACGCHAVALNAQQVHTSGP